MQHELMQNFIQLIATHTGLLIRDQDQKDLRNKIYLRMKSLKLSTPEQYYQLLIKENGKGVFPVATTRESEWQELSRLLTIGETYFFRDQGQLTLLKDQILPELIALKNQGQYAPSLKIWSAGCSTGEEAYSLAILTQELIPNWDEWNICILGTDINSESIKKAQQGIYSEWSFRTVTPEIKQQYFIKKNTVWQVNEQIQKIVKFQTGNLLQDDFPSLVLGIHNIDIIICRNVFIYFDSKSISTVLEKFYHTLVPGGYLITGHTELHRQNLSQLQAKVFPQSVIYQRSINSASATALTGNLFTAEKQVNTANKNAVLQARFPAGSLKNRKSNKFIQPQFIERSQTKENLKGTAPQTTLKQVEQFLNVGDYTNAIKQAEQIIKQHPEITNAYYLLAEALANLGELEKATHWCQQVIKFDPLAIEPYYLLAQIAEEQGNIKQAKFLLKKIIYLMPFFVVAYLDLGCLYENEGDYNKATKMRKTALEMLKKLPPHTTIEPQNQITANELIVQIKTLLHNYI